MHNFQPFFWLLGILAVVPLDGEVMLPALRVGLWRTSLTLLTWVCWAPERVPFLLSGEGTRLDLAVCRPSLFLGLEWSVRSDLCGSDHFPTCVGFSESQSEEGQSHWRFSEADWDLFRLLVAGGIGPDVLTSEDAAASFSDILMKCAGDSIPGSSGEPDGPGDVWFNDECGNVQR